MKFKTMYYRNLMTRNAFDSSHIEGNRLSFETTDEIINENYTKNQIID